ncbi:MAG: hypothetical protein BEN19_05610 [Epulopiscium sp. Nuni2H_MBin003]|nr:MAG: hypothetical protein BEN19_05610 [Epulopiscium sp. Nuni2H_MBin003]
MVDKHIIGQLVFSKAGRDKNRPLIIVGLENEYVFVVDGRTHKVDKPKLKKMKHVQPTSKNIKLIANKIIRGEYISNDDIKKAICDNLSNSKGG